MHLHAIDPKTKSVQGDAVHYAIVFHNYACLVYVDRSSFSQGIGISRLQNIFIIIIFSPLCTTSSLLCLYLFNVIILFWFFFLLNFPKEGSSTTRMGTCTKTCIIWYPAVTDSSCLHTNEITVEWNAHDIRNIYSSRHITEQQYLAQLIIYVVSFYYFCDVSTTARPPPPPLKLGEKLRHKKRTIYIMSRMKV